MAINAKRISKYVRVFLLVLGLVLVIACGSEAVVESGTGQNVTAIPTAVPSPDAEAGRPLPGAARILASGEFRLLAANAFGEPGFHEVLTATHDLPSDLSSITGKRLVLRLWDAGRPERNCNSEHPLSGCATVDWSDAPGRPNVPPGGVFDNSITFQFAAGERNFFLSESSDLNDQPDSFDPG